MKLFEQLIRKEIELSEENLVQRNYKRYIWRFYIAYNISRALIGYSDPLMRVKIRIYRKFLVSPENVSSKLYKKMQKFMRKDISIIVQALAMIQKIKEEAGYEFGEYYKPLTLGILSADYPEE